MPKRQLKRFLKDLAQQTEGGNPLICSPHVGSKAWKQLLSITFPSMSLGWRQDLVQSLFGRQARKMMVSSRSELAVTSKQTVSLSLTVVLMPQSTPRSRVPTQLQSFKEENVSLLTTLKLLQQVRDLSSPGQESTEDLPNQDDSN